MDTIFKNLVPLSDQELQKLVDKESNEIKRLMEKKNKDSMKYREYMRKQGLNEKDFSTMSFDDLRRHYQLNKETTEREQKERLARETKQYENIDKLMKRYGGKCKYLIEKSMEMELVDSLSKTSL